MSASLVGEGEVNPGASTKVEVSIATAGRSGPISKTISVETDHPDHARVPLEVSVNVVVDLDFETNFVRFDDVKLGQKREQVIALIAADPGSVKLGKPVVTGEGVTAKIVKTGAGKSAKWSIKVVLEPGKVGQAFGAIDVKLLAPEQKDLKLQFTGQVLE